MGNYLCGKHIGFLIWGHGYRWDLMGSAVPLLKAHKHCYFLYVVLRICLGVEKKGHRLYFVVLYCNL